MIKTTRNQTGNFIFSHIGLHDRTTIVGQTGQGKSVLMHKLMHFFAKKTLVILIDVKDEYKDIPELDLKVLQKTKGLFRIIEIEDDGLIIDDMMVICEWISKVLYEREDCILAIEELGDVTKKGGRLSDVMKNYNNVLTKGRTHRIGFIGTTQRPQMVHTSIISQSQHIISFLVTSGHDLKAMGAYIDKDKYDDLERYQFFHVNFAKNYLKRCYKLRLSAAEVKYYTDLFGET